MEHSFLETQEVLLTFGASVSSVSVKQTNLN